MRRMRRRRMMMMMEEEDDDDEDDDDDADADDDDDDVSQVKLRVGPSSNQPSSRQVASRTRHPGQIWRADGEKQHLAPCL